MYGKSRIVPIIGTLRKKLTATGKKPLKSENVGKIKHLKKKIKLILIMYELLLSHLF